MPGNYHKPIPTPTRNPPHAARLTRVIRPRLAGYVALAFQASTFPENRTGVQ